MRIGVGKLVKVLGSFFNEKEIKFNVNRCLNGIIGLEELNWDVG